MVKKYIKVNETTATPIIEYSPQIFKAGHAKNGKQMYRCTSYNKRFVSDTGQLTFYSHQSLSK